ncbi:MAG: cell division protein FtsZ, cell division protein FtsZ [Candidatus Parcubacteria bacterium]|nr:cell division protein FtsZ, cell division protein FtsZ [Candidatus Parcubacteria bacterium]
MPNITPDIEAFARIKVLGVGGSGKNAVNHMINSKVKGVDFITINTDSQELHGSLAKKKIHIGKNLTRGLGTGMNPDLGRRAAEETRDEIQESIKGADMVFVTCGEGGGTGTGVSPTVARIAKELGCLTVAVVTKPFFFEGRQRSRIAEAGLEELRKEVDAIIIIPNDRLLAAIDKTTTVKNAFAMCDDILRQAVQGISDLITTPGLMNIDFADIRTVMENSGSALMGIGSASGENRAIDAARAAINSPLLEVSITGAKGVLFSIAGGEDLTMFEIQDAAKVITESIDPEAKIIFGTVRDDKLKKNEIKVTVIATGFPEGATPATSSVGMGLGQNASKPASAPTESSLASLMNSKTSGEKGKIYNTIGGQTSDIKRDPTMPAKPERVELGKDAKKEVKADEDDDWGAVPAFLRRSRLK